MRGTQALDLVICFECKQVEIYRQGKRSDAGISPTPQAQFDQALKAAGLPLARETQ